MTAVGYMKHLVRVADYVWALGSRNDMTKYTSYIYSRIGFFKMQLNLSAQAILLYTPSTLDEM